jgi:glycosyltransferase involved in cell wall biosynthesis
VRIAIPMKAFDATWGGPGTYTIELIKRLVHLPGNHEYVLIYPGDVTARIDPVREGVEQVPTRRRRGIVWDQVTVAKVARNVEADLLFSPFMSIPLRGKLKKIFTIHGAERYVVPGMLRPHQNLRWMFMDQLLVRAADRIIAVSQTMAHEYCRVTHCDPAKVRAIPLGVSDEFHVIEEPERLAGVRAKHSLPDPFILFVGKLFPNKNFGNLVRAFARIADRIPHQLVVAGGVRWKFEDDVELVSKLKLESRVTFVDFVSREDLIALYNMADCFAYPSLYESFGLAQIEAMACGCPVVAANTGALPEIAGDAALLCDPMDPQAIADGLLRTVSDRQFHAAQRARGLGRARLYTWDRCAIATAQVFDEFAG